MQKCKVEAKKVIALKWNGEFIYNAPQIQELFPWSQYDCDILNPFVWEENSLLEITAGLSPNGWMILNGVFVSSCHTKSKLSFMCLNSIKFFLFEK